MNLIIPTPLSKRLSGLNKIELDAYSLPEMVSMLRSGHDQLYKLIFTPEGRLNGFVNLYLNQECITEKLDSDRTLNKEDNVEILVSVSGG